MNYAFNAIKDEHRSLATVLHALRDLVARIRDGAVRPDFDGLRAMLYYLDGFSSRLHHPQEDEFLFQPLREHGDEAAALVDDLEREHARVAEAMRSLEQALLRYEEGGEREFVAFATAVEGLCAFYLQHMRKEEMLALPLAEKLFGEQQWADIEAACAPRGGLDEGEEFQRLFRRIVGANLARQGAAAAAALP